jgi:hypothetical protein
MDRKKHMTFRASDSDRDFIEKEAVRLRKLLGKNISMSDVIRLGLEAYDERLKEEGIDHGCNFER